MVNVVHKLFKTFPQIQFNDNKVMKGYCHRKNFIQSILQGRTFICQDVSFSEKTVNTLMN